MVLLAAWKNLALFAPAAAGLLTPVTAPAPAQGLPETTGPLKDWLSIAGQDAAAFEQSLTDHQAGLEATHHLLAGWPETVRTYRQDHKQWWQELPAIADRNEDPLERGENVRDRSENRHDRRENVDHRREEQWARWEDWNDNSLDLEDVLDRREDRRDSREDQRATGGRIAFIG